MVGSENAAFQRAIFDHGFASARAMPRQMHGSRRSVSIRESGPFTGRGSCRRPGFHGWLVLRRILGGGMLPAASSPSGRSVGFCRVAFGR